MSECVEEPDWCDVLGHDTRTTYEDEDGIQWKCVRCGAEGWDDPS